MTSVDLSSKKVGIDLTFEAPVTEVGKYLNSRIVNSVTEPNIETAVRG